VAGARPGEHAERTVGLYERRIFPWLCALAVRRFAAQRREVVGTAAGRVLEVGVGVGASLPCYTEQATEVVAIDVSAAMLEKARARLRALAGAGPTAFTLAVGSAQALEFADDTFDTVVAFLVFCSLPDPQAAAAEMFRVLKPNGKLVFFEHVYAGDNPLGTWQRRLNPLWQRLAGGCNLTRDTRAILERAGFRFAEIDEYVHGRSPKLIGLKIQGMAVKPLAG
jgi:ubiquinone/menaquinone biosynthesis C-methylase UbiE